MVRGPMVVNVQKIVGEEPEYQKFNTTETLLQRRVEMLNTERDSQWCKDMGEQGDSSKA